MTQSWSRPLAEAPPASRSTRSALGPTSTDHKTRFVRNMTVWRDMFFVCMFHLLSSSRVYMPVVMDEMKEKYEVRVSD